MSQCVPSWELDGNASGSGRRPLLSPVNSSAPAAQNIPMLDYEVAELTWENGQVALHGLGLPRVPTRPPPETSSSAPAKYAWDNKPRDGGTLESIVKAATTQDEDELVPWFNRRSDTVAYGGASAAMAMDALVPCPNVQRSDVEQKRTRAGNAASTYTPVGSCSGPVRLRDEENFETAKRARTAAGRGEWSRMDQMSVSGSARDDDSRRLTLGGFTSTTSLGSPENTKTTAAEDSVCHNRSQREVGDEEEKNKRAGKSLVSTKRSRAAAIHNQSERKRRDKINQRMKTLQKLVPNSNKTDKASMLDEVIEYLKQLQAQVNMMSLMNMPSMMLPMAMQQQLQMSMMGGPLGMGMGMGMMDMNTMNRAPTNMMPNPFMSMANASWDGNGSNDNNPMAAFLACQSQPMSMDAYSRMASLYQQLQLLQQHQQQQQQQPASSRKS